MARTCSQCGKSYPDSTTFCIDDGNPLVAQPQAYASTLMGGAATKKEAVYAVPAQMTPASQASVPTGETTTGDPVPTATSQQAVAHAFEDPQLIELRSGTAVGEYVIDKQIGEGGMGVIYSAKQPIIGKRVAIKVLNPDMAANVAIVQRFIQEARAVNQIGNRNIVDIFSFGRLPDGRHYFVMEFLDGMPFSKRIEQPIVWTEAMNIWLQVCSAVEAAHQHGIVHRDLKPDNIFITPGADGPFVKVLDFGIAKLMGGENGAVMKTSTGVPMGTPLYMSPEQTRGGAVDHRTDVYAMGIILYETITGVTPFHAPSFFEVMSKQLTEAPPPFPTETNIAPELSRLIYQCLEKEAEARPASMGELRDRLMDLRETALRAGEALFERPGQPWTRPEPGTAPQPTQREARTERQAVRPRTAGDHGYTVPDPRESQMMAAQRAAAAANQTGSKAGLYGALAGVVMVGLAGLGWVVTHKPQPAPAPVAIAPPPPQPVVPEAPKDGQLILVTQSGVTVFLDDKQVAEGGPTIHLKAPPGHHQIKVTRPGFLPFSKDVVFVAGDTVGETATLDPEKAPPGPPVKGHHGDKKPVEGDKKPTQQQPLTKDGTINPFGN